MSPSLSLIFSLSEQVLCWAARRARPGRLHPRLTRAAAWMDATDLPVIEGAVIRLEVDRPHTTPTAGSAASRAGAQRCDRSVSPTAETGQRFRPPPRPAGRASAGRSVPGRPGAQRPAGPATARRAACPVRAPGTRPPASNPRFALVVSVSSPRSLIMTTSSTSGCRRCRYS
jgi:hypothetical protein